MEKEKKSSINKKEQYVCSGIEFLHKENTKVELQYWLEELKKTNPDYTYEITTEVLKNQVLNANKNINIPDVLEAIPRVL